MLTSLFLSLLGTANALDVIVLSDLNSSYGSLEYSWDTLKAVNYIIAQDPDLVIITGDMVAGQKKGLPYEEMWAAFHKAVTLPLESHNIPVAITPGNHDASGYSRFAYERELYNTEWLNHIPEVEFVDDSNYPFYYAFEMANTLFISLDNTKIEGLGQIQKTWLANILKTDSKNTIVFGHLPIVPFAEKKQTEYLQDPGIHPLLIKNNVDLYISGHHHAYYPGIFDELHVLSMPCLGSGSRHLIDSSTRSKKGLVKITITQESMQLDAFDTSNNLSLIERTSLPQIISTEIGTVYRDDLYEYTSFLHSDAH